MSPIALTTTTTRSPAARRAAIRSATTLMRAGLASGAASILLYYESHSHLLCELRFLVPEFFMFLSWNQELKKQKRPSMGALVILGYLRFG